MTNFHEISGNILSTGGGFNAILLIFCYKEKHDESKTKICKILALRTEEATRVTYVCGYRRIALKFNVRLRCSQ